MGRLGGGVFLLSVTGPHILPIPYPNLYGRDVTVYLIHVGTITSVLIITPVDLMVPLLESPKIPQFPPPRPLLCGMYPPAGTFSHTLSGSVSYFRLWGGGPLLNQSASVT